LQQRDSARKHLGQMKGQYTLGLNDDKAALAAAIDAMEGALKPIEHIINAFETGGSAMASADNVRHFNALQFQSGRAIGSSRPRQRGKALAAATVTAPFPIAGLCSLRGRGRLRFRR
jgi:hypothetical protein